MLALVMVWAATLITTFALPSRAEGNLLAGRAPLRSQGVSNVKVLTDGARAHEGDDWNSTAAAVLESDRAFVEFDLGSSKPIVAAYVQGDNNDEYLLAISEDGKTFSPLWNAGPRSEPGLRERWNDTLDGKGRYLRLTARGGDRAYSVTELQVFSEKPKNPPALGRVSGESQASRVRTCLLYLGAAFAVWLFATHASSATLVLALGAGLVLVAGGLAYDAADSAWPLANREVAYVRAISGAIALLAVLRRAIAAKRFPAHRHVVTAALATSAVLAFASFYNLGRPQFWNHKENRPEFVHTYDMRVYQPFAKYFKELQYDGVYLASVMAYAEDQRNGSLESMSHVEVRGLSDHKVRRVGDITQQVQDIKKRFTPERWAELRKDMLYFEEVMGPEFIGTLTDHGANATPVWVFFARLMLGSAPAGESLLTWAGLADGVLLLLMAAAMWKTFGLWPMLIAMTVFGANDLYMFGTNWSGATLRHDWLVFLGFGACALKAQRWALGGACLALAAMIRAFPGAALLGVSIPGIWWLIEYWQTEKKLPTPKEVYAAHPETVRVLAGAIGTMLFAFLFTGLLYGFHVWGNWWDKVTLLNRDVGVNEVSLRALVAGADGNAGRVLQARRLIHVGAIIIAVVSIFMLGRRRPLHQAMLIGLPLALVIWNPSNYYSHLVFLLALLGSVVVPKKAKLAERDPDEEEPKFEALAVPLHQVAAPLLVMCVAGYWSALEPDLERHFQNETVLLFTAFIWLYVNLAKRDPKLKATLSAAS
ncbi:MAG: hypothetical protein ACOY0T_08030 [Myxococcota bacterium]